MSEQNSENQEQKQGKDPVSGAIDTVNNARNAVQGIRTAFQGIQTIVSAVSTFPVWGPILGIILAAAALIIIIVVIIAYLLGFIGGGTAQANNGGGNPNIPPGAPIGCPITGVITTPFGSHIPGYTWPDGTPINGGNHDGVDIAPPQPVEGIVNVYSTLAGTAQQNESVTAGHEVIVTSDDGTWIVEFFHLEDAGRVPSGTHVNVGQSIGIEDNSGSSVVGNGHLHYQIFHPQGTLQDPLLYMPVTLNFTIPPPSDYPDFSSFGPAPAVWGMCNTLPQDTPVGGVTPNGKLNFYIPYQDRSILIDPAIAANTKAAADISWPDNNINKPCPGGLTCWDYVIAQSIDHNINPSFSIAIWEEEGGFGGLVKGSRAKSEFGCGSYPGDFMGSFNCFLDFTASHPYNPNDPLGSFTEWLSSFCGSNQPTICGNNPNILVNLPIIYNTLAPGTIVYVNPITQPLSDSGLFIFSDAGEKPWTQAEKDAVNQAINTPVQSTTWKNLVFSAGKITLKRSPVDSSCPDVCSALAEGTDTVILRDKFFSLTTNGKVFVITHELTHLLQARNPQVETAFRAGSAYQEFLAKGVIRSYPLCSGSTCQQGLSPFNENFAEMAGNYVTDRDGYQVDFPVEYPEQYKFARDTLFGGTGF